MDARTTRETSVLINNDTRESSAKPRTALCILAVIQMLLGLSCLCLWWPVKNQSQEATKWFGMVSAAANMITGGAAMATGLRNSNCLAVLGRGSAVISCLCNIIVVYANYVQWHDHDQHGNESTSDEQHVELSIIPFVFLVLCILEIACYSIIQKDSQYELIYGSAMGTPRSLPWTAATRRDTGNYGAIIINDDIASTSQRPPAYSDPPAYNSVVKDDGKPMRATVNPSHLA